jgi:hypothetical protein
MTKTRYWCIGSGRNVTCEDNCDRLSCDMVYGIPYTLLFSQYFRELKIKILEYKMSDAKKLPVNFLMQKKLKFQLPQALCKQHSK